MMKDNIDYDARMKARQAQAWREFRRKHPFQWLRNRIRVKFQTFLIKLGYWLKKGR